LTTGILDAAVLGNVLNRILKLGESEDLLSEYEGTRRKAFLEFTNPLSIANKERMTSTDPAKVAEREWFFNKLNTDEDFHLMINRGMDHAMEETFEVPKVL
jgi:2-polyprenyl-6-methoxyphenol hydroxylase-like FAD-dependent oxidoreductase